MIHDVNALDPKAFRDEIKYWQAHQDDQSDDGQICKAYVEALDFIRGRLPGAELSTRLIPGSSNALYAGEFHDQIMTPDDGPFGDGDIRTLLNCAALVSARGSELSDDDILKFSKIACVAERDLYDCNFEVVVVGDKDDKAERKNSFTGISDEDMLSQLMDIPQKPPETEQSKPETWQSMGKDDLVPEYVAVNSDTPDRDTSSMERGAHDEENGQGSGDAHDHVDNHADIKPVEGKPFDGVGMTPDEFRKQIQYWEAHKNEDTELGHECEAMTEALEYARLRIKDTKLPDRLQNTINGSDDKMSPSRFGNSVLKAYEKGPCKGDIRDYLNSEALEKKRGKKLSDEEIAAWIAAAAVAERDKHGIGMNDENSPCKGMDDTNVFKMICNSASILENAVKPNDDTFPAGVEKPPIQFGPAKPKTPLMVDGSAKWNKDMSQLQLLRQEFPDIITDEKYAQYMIVSTVLDIMERNVRSYATDSVTEYLMRPGGSFADRRIAKRMQRTSREYARSVESLRGISGNMWTSMADTVIAQAGGNHTGKTLSGSSPLHGIQRKTQAAAGNLSGPADAATFTQRTVGNGENVRANVRTGLNEAMERNQSAGTPSLSDAEQVFEATIAETPDPSRPPVHKKITGFFAGLGTSIASKFSAVKNKHAVQKDAEDYVEDPDIMPEDLYDEAPEGDSEYDIAPSNRSAQPEAATRQDPEAAYDEPAPGPSMPASDVSALSGEDEYDEEPGFAAAGADQTGRAEPAGTGHSDEEPAPEAGQSGSGGVPAPEPAPATQHTGELEPEPGPVGLHMGEPESVSGSEPVKQRRMLSGPEILAAAKQTVSDMCAAIKAGEPIVQKASSAADEAQQKLMREAGIDTGSEASRMDRAAEMAEAAAQAQPADAKPRAAEIMSKLFQRDQHKRLAAGSDNPFHAGLGS